MRAGVEFAPGSDHVFIHGGLLNLNSATNAVSGLIFGRGIQGCYAQDVREQGVAQGDGFLNLGCNVGTLLNNEFASNLIGVHMLGSPGYASNNIKVLGNIITGNQRWGNCRWRCFAVSDWLAGGKWFNFYDSRREFAEFQ